METDCRWMQHNDLLGKQPAENQLSRSIAEPLLVLFLAGLLGRTAGRALVLGQVFLVSRQIPTEALDDLGVGRREVLGFPNVLLQVVEFVPLQFPFSASHCLGTVEECLVRALGALAPFQQRQEILAIDHTVSGKLCSGKSGASGKKVHAGGHFGALLAGGNPSWPPHHGGHPHPALEAGKFVTFERMSKATDATVHVALHPGVGCQLPRAVIGGVYDQGVLIELQLAKGLEDLSGRPIEFLDGVPVKANLAFALEERSRIEGNVRHGVGKVDEEGFLLILLDEGNGFLGVALGQGVLVGGVFDDFSVAHQRNEVFLHPALDVLQSDPFSQDDVVGQGLSWVEGHVVAVGNAEVGVEPLAGRQKLLEVPEVPLPDAGGRIALGLEQVRDRDLIGIETPLVPRKENAQVAHPAGIATGQKSGP